MNTTVAMVNYKFQPLDLDNLTSESNDPLAIVLATECLLTIQVETWHKGGPGPQHQPWL
jgi:hypothetical protein